MEENKIILQGIIRTISYSGSPINCFYRGIEQGIIKFDVDKGQALIELSKRSAIRLRDDLTRLLRDHRREEVIRTGHEIIGRAEE